MLRQFRGGHRLCAGSCRQLANQITLDFWGARSGGDMQNIRRIVSAITISEMLLLLTAQASSVIAQTGAVPLICIDNNNTNNRVGFDIDYDRKTIHGDLARGRGQY